MLVVETAAQHVRERPLVAEHRDVRVLPPGARHDRWRFASRSAPAILFRLETSRRSRPKLCEPSRTHGSRPGSKRTLSDAPPLFSKTTLPASSAASLSPKLGRTTLFSVSHPARGTD